jgi:energy-coupling factor transporter ATP-binding protein EcfA2
VAIGAAIAVEPRVLVRTSRSASWTRLGEEVIATIRALVGDGMTVVVAEHRVERLAALADRVRTVGEGGARSGERGARDGIVAAIEMDPTTVAARGSLQGRGWSRERLSGFKVRISDRELPIPRSAP